jgi:hypothetical protein
LVGSGRIAPATFLAQLLLLQIGLELFIGKTTAQTSGGNCQCRCNFYWPATRHHMPRAFRQRIGIGKRKLTTRRSTLMRHSLWYRVRLTSSNAEVAFVRANFTAGRGHAWEGGRAPRSGIEAPRATSLLTVRHACTVELADPTISAKAAVSAHRFRNGAGIVASVCSVLNVNDNAPVVRYIAVCLQLNIVQLERFSGMARFPKLSSGEPSRN